ncbi:MAG: hypothetical protein ACNA8J_07325 [Gammaproteobacteria bacterium]
MAAQTVGPLAINIDGALPVIHTRTDPVLASRVGVGDARLRYGASYTVEPGEVFANQPLAPGRAPPKRLGAQRFGHDFSMRLPPVGGAPIALDFTTETREQWTTTGATSSQQRQVASLAWAPRFGSLELQWAADHSAIDKGLALGCELGGTLRLPLRSADAAEPLALRVSARDCKVVTSSADYSELAADAWTVALAWGDAGHQAEILVSMIEPAWHGAPGRQAIDPSYEFGVSHRIDHGLWSTRTLVAMRYTSAWELAAPMDARGHYLSDAEAYWLASASLTRHLPAVSLSADWTHGADPMWFMPAIGERRHRLDMRLDLSRLFAALAPDVQPEVSMRWNWSQSRSRSNDITAASAIRLDMAVLW